MSSCDSCSVICRRSCRSSQRIDGSTSASRRDDPAGAARESASVRAARADQRLRRRHGRPGADRAALARRAGVRSQLEDGHHVVHREFRYHQGCPEPHRRPVVGARRAKAAAGHRLALRAPRANDRIASGRLPPPHWTSVLPGSCPTGHCDGCSEAIGVSDYAFSVVVGDSLSFHFHDECFEVYNRSTPPVR